MMQFLGRCSRNWVGSFAIIFAVVIFSSSAIAQPVDPFPPEVWHNVYDSTYGHDVGYGVALDSNQNVIIAGYRNSGSTDAIDAYAVKFDSRGNFLCEREVKGPQSPNQVSFTDSFTSVAVDSQDNIILAGQISGNWYGAEGYHNAAYLNKYDSECNALWAQPVIYHEQAFGDSAWQEINGVVVDPSDNILAAGRVFAAWATGREGDWATWKYNASGVLQGGFPWYYNYSTSYIYADSAYDIAVDSLGNIIAVGVRGVSGCDGCPSNNIDWHVRKYNSLGALLWEDTYSGTANLYDYAYRVAVDSQNNVIVVGYTNKGTDNTATNVNYDWLVIKYSADGFGGAGQRLWTYTYESDSGRSEAAQAVAVDANDNVIVGGQMRVDSATVYGRLALLDGATGNLLGERIITVPLNVIPLRLSYRDGAIAIGGYIWDSSGTNHNIYAALLQDTSDPIAPTSPANGTTFDACSYFAPPLFQWTLNETFQKLEIRIFTPANPAKPAKVKVKDPAATQLQMTQSTWKKVLKLPGLSGGELNWKIVGTNKGLPIVESEVFTMTIAAPEFVGNPVISPVTQSEIPTLTWENSCGTKFKAYFSADSAFSKSKKLSFKYQGSTNPDDPLSATLTDKTWLSIRKLIGDIALEPIYWKVESWDIIKRFKTTDVMEFTLLP